MDDDDQASTSEAPEDQSSTGFSAPGLPAAPEGGWGAGPPQPDPQPDPVVSAGPGATGGPSPSGTTTRPYEQQAAAAAELAAGPTMRGPMSLISMGIVLFLLALAGWWAQDAIGTFANDGEARMGHPVRFRSDGGAYRLLASGPLRPDPNSTWCDITTADGKTRTEVGGQGLQTERLGVDRLLTFHPPAGETTVTCSFRGTGDGSGRFQVLATGSPVTRIPLALLLVALLSIAAGAAWAWSVVARTRRQN